jgi:hypothetical protein
MSRTALQSPNWDYLVNNQGSIFILTPTSDLCKMHVDERMPADAQRWGGGYVVEHRYIDDILADLEGEGFVGKSI